MKVGNKINMCLATGNFTGLEFINTPNHASPNIPLLLSQPRTRTEVYR